jgi:putative ABC transport system permease protein
VARLRLYLRYSTRSLRRGGQRTVLGIFCIAVGVMAVVALRLAADMISTSLTTNVREANGGDVSVVSTAIPLTSSELAVFPRLQRQGLVDQFVTLGVQRATLRHDGGRTSANTLYVLDQPSAYPLVGGPGFAKPAGGTFASALQAPDSVVLTQFAATQLGVTTGSTVHLTVVGGTGVDTTVTGILSDRVAVNIGSSSAFISGMTYRQLSSQPEAYGVVEMTTPGAAKATSVATQLRAQFPAATVQTVQDALDANVTASQQVTQYLEIIGLLALAIGGIGIVNTLQVMLSRRRVEIAMLKTSGYRRRDLYALFGLEAGMLGLLGGVLGTAAGVGMSVVVKTLIEQVVSIRLSFEVAATTLLAGVAVGVVTSLIFGLLPIVRAAGIRPAAVLRDQAEGISAASLVQSAGLYALVIALFVALAASILGDALFALEVVLYTLVGLVAIGGIFSGIVALVGRWPVPERITAGYLVLVTAVVAIAAFIAIPLRGVGVALLVLAGCGYVMLFLPRAQRTVAKLALRSLRRSRARTAGTLVALFVGVFTIGLILVLGQDISSELNDAFSNLASYNVFVIASAHDAAHANAATKHLDGLEGRRLTEDVAVRPISINGVSLGQVLGAASPSPRPGGERDFRLFALTGVEGYDLAGGSMPGAAPLANGGRALGRVDAGTDNVMVLGTLQFSPFNMKVGDSVTVVNVASQQMVTLHVVGFYSQATRSSGGGIKVNFFFQPMLVDRSVVAQLGENQASTIVALKLNPDQKLADLRAIEGATPGVTVLDLADLSSLVQQVLGNLVDLLIGIASLALFAGAVIIANTVALAMLERRREIGILKSTGYTSRAVLAQVLVENGLVGGIGAIAGMAMVSLATALLGGLALKTKLAVGAPIVLVIIAGMVLLAMVVSALVAWRPSRIRPLEVLRYE